MLTGDRLENKLVTLLSLIKLLQRYRCSDYAGRRTPVRLLLAHTILVLDNCRFCCPEEEVCGSVAVLVVCVCPDPDEVSNVLVLPTDSAEIAWQMKCSG